MKRTFVATFVLLFVGMVHLAGQQATSRNLYPHELPGFKFYVTSLSPLRPYVSDEAAVVRVLGSDQGETVDSWRMLPLYVGDAGPAKGRLAEVQVIPQQRVSMRSVRFPPAFKHSIGSVSEVNVSCDVYTDDDGLQYWFYAEDSAVGNKGDLMHIVYGATDGAKQRSASGGR